jgi:hypothetical protein
VLLGLLGLLGQEYSVVAAAVAEEEEEEEAASPQKIVDL